MRDSDAPNRRRFVKYALGSLVLWLAAVAAVYWYLRTLVEQDLRGGGVTNADSIGLPLMSFAILLAVVLVMANLARATIGLWRHRRLRQVGSRPAV